MRRMIIYYIIIFNSLPYEIFYDLDERTLQDQFDRSLEVGDKIIVIGFFNYFPFESILIMKI
jgi:hypothetical protein